MKKCQFFSMICEGGKSTVKMQNGYTDGEFNYYSARRGYWYCIDPQTGLSIASGSTKEKAQQLIKDNIDRFENVKSTEYYKKCVEQFAKLRLYGGEVAKDVEKI